MTGSKRFLFLQGVCSPFFPRLAEALRQAGHSVRKINFTVGDSVYWRKGESTAYRGPMAGLESFYARQFELYGITDIVLFGDCRPVHRPAIELAKTLGIEVHVFEEGYFRPYWITLERQGVNGHSQLPRDPAWYRAQKGRVPDYDNGMAFRSPFWKRAAYDVGYNFWAGLNPILHYGVRSHVPYSPAAEYLSYLRRGRLIRKRRAQDAETISKVLAEPRKKPFFVLPLQLATDAQITHHSNFRDMLEALEFTMTSFARNAPAHISLLVKAHPLDPGLVDYTKRIDQLKRELGLNDRVHYIESGDLPPLLSKTRGVVTVNSTVGSSAILHGRSTIALGNAIYHMPGLTFQGALDDFWTTRIRPDLELFRCFRNAVIHHSQINGGFYSSSAIEKAIAGSLPKLCNTKVLYHDQ